VAALHTHGAHTTRARFTWSKATLTLDDSALVSVQLTHRSHTPTRAYQKGIVALTGTPEMASCATYAAIAIIAMRPFQISPSWSE
jgi:hypothetical protein